MSENAHVRFGVFPGSFNPPTQAHLAIAQAARVRADLDILQIVVSRVSLGKPKPNGPNFEVRIDVLRSAIGHLSGVEVVVTDEQLLVDIAKGADALVVGADKWRQIHEPHWYGSDDQMRSAIASLPRTLIARRAGHLIVPNVPIVDILEIDQVLRTYSSTGARTTNPEWMAPAAYKFAEDTGGWDSPGWDPAVRDAESWETSFPPDRVNNERVGFSTDNETDRFLAAKPFGK